jgi:hypothetical protein
MKKGREAALGIVGFNGCCAGGGSQRASTRTRRETRSLHFGSISKTNGFAKGLRHSGAWLYLYACKKEVFWRKARGINNQHYNWRSVIESTVVIMAPGTSQPPRQVGDPTQALLALPWAGTWTDRFSTSRFFFSRPSPAR